MTWLADNLTDPFAHWALSRSEKLVVQKENLLVLNNWTALFFRALTMLGGASLDPRKFWPLKCYHWFWFGFNGKFKGGLFPNCMEFS